jgi:hypothetical protein
LWQTLGQYETLGQWTTTLWLLCWLNETFCLFIGSVWSLVSRISILDLISLGLRFCAPFSSFFNGGHQNKNKKNVVILKNQAWE